MSQTFFYTKQTLPKEPPVREPQRQYYFMWLLREQLKEREASLGRKLTMHIETFGCQMNAKDSEKLAGILETVGYVSVPTEEADLVLYNTCTVRENANTRVYGRIGYLGNCKKKNPDMRILLCGCMMQEPHVIEKLKKSYRFVDVVFGTHNIYMLAELLYRRETEGKMVVSIQEEATEIVEDLPTTQKYGFKAGINIMYGCNNFCSYCIVPYVRGRERSRDPEDILREARELAAKGVKEVMLLGQNVNSYGKTLAEPKSFAWLIHQVSLVDGIERIRFMTPHPKDLSYELIEEIRDNPKICKHVHLPVQSGSTELLKRMNRRYTKEHYLNLVAKIKEQIPGVAITTDIIVGFPGETEEDFQDTLSVVEQSGYMSAYTFIYSKRSGTPAASMEEQVPADVANERFQRLLDVVARVSSAEARKYTGEVQMALCEERNEETGLITGRLDNNLLVHFPGDASLLGKLVRVKLAECKGFYYLGEQVG